VRIAPTILCIGFLLLVVGAGDGRSAQPEVPAACPALPTGDLITALATGQAVTSGSNVTLRFSSKVFSCSEWSNEVSTVDCQDWWNLQLTVPADAMTPGVHKLAEIGTDFGDLVNRFHKEAHDGCNSPLCVGNGCDHCVGGTQGTGSVRLVDAAATLEIFAADDKCITGKLTGVRDPNFQDAPNFNGEFFALRCP
jgi:hypothetical protein